MNYIDKLNEEISTKSSISGAPEKTVLAAVHQAILGASRITEVFNTATLKGKTTFVPVAKIPAPTDTTFSVTGMEITKEDTSSSATIIDEVIENAAANIEPVFEANIANQTILKVEQKISDVLKALENTANGNNPTELATVLKLLKSFPKQYNSIVGEKYLFVSYDTKLDLLASFSYSEWQLFNTLNIEIVCGYGMADKEMVLVHSAGLAGGFAIRRVEYDRLPASNKSTLLVSAVAGAQVSSDYYKKTSLA